MSTIQLGEDIQVDTSEITSVAYEKKGAKISGKTVTVSSGGDFGDLRVPEDSLIVRLASGAEFAIRGEAEARNGFDLLREAKDKQNLSFALETHAGD